MQGIEVVVGRQQQAWSAIAKGRSRQQHFPVIWSKTELQKIQLISGATGGTSALLVALVVMVLAGYSTSRACH